MKWLKRLFWCGLLLSLVVVVFVFCLPYFNDYQSEGKLALTGLRKPVTVKRDKKGMAFMDGSKLYWWFSDKAINEHTKSTLVLEPKQN